MKWIKKNDYNQSFEQFFFIVRFIKKKKETYKDIWNFKNLSFHTFLK